MPTLTIKHTTVYRYRQPVAFGEHRMMLRPRDGHDQSVIEEKLVVSPTPISLCRIQDQDGNHIDVARFAHRAKELRFESTIRIDHSHADIDDIEIEDFARAYPFDHGMEDMPELARFVARRSLDPHGQVESWARTFLRSDHPTNTLGLLTNLTFGIKRTFKQVRRDEKGVQSPLQTLELGSGSCRDFAMLMIDAVRSLGMAARFVSGYLHILDDDEVGGNTHAWAQVYLPGPGWVDFDPTSGIVGNRDLIRVAMVHDPSLAIPLHGTWTGFPSDYLGMDVGVVVTSDASGSEITTTDFARRMKSGT